MRTNWRNDDLDTRHCKISLIVCIKDPLASAGFHEGGNVYESLLSLPTSVRQDRASVGGTRDGLPATTVGSSHKNRAHSLVTARCKASFTETVSHCSASRRATPFTSLHLSSRVAMRMSLPRLAPQASLSVGAARRMHARSPSQRLSSSSGTPLVSSLTRYNPVWSEAGRASPNLSRQNTVVACGLHLVRRRHRGWLEPCHHAAHACACSNCDG